MSRLISTLVYFLAFSLPALADGLQATFWYYEERDAASVKKLLEQKEDTARIAVLETLKPIMTVTCGIKRGPISRSVFRIAGKRGTATYSDVRMEGEGSISFDLTIAEDVPREKPELAETTTLSVEIVGGAGPNIQAERKLEERTPFRISIAVRQLPLSAKRLCRSSGTLLPGMMTRWEGLVVQVTGQPLKTDLSADADGVPWSDEELVAFYARGLTVPDPQFRRAAIEALGGQAGGYEILFAYLKANLHSEDVFLIASILEKFEIPEARGREIFALYENAKDNAKDKRSNASRALVGLLIKKFPERFRYFEYFACLAEIERNPDLKDETINRVAKLVISMPREQMYRYVPVLCDALKATWLPYKEKVHALLVSITGKHTKYDKTQSPEQLAEVVDVYRGLYYTELKPKVPEVDKKILSSPFGDPGEKEIRDRVPVPW